MTIKISGDFSGEDKYKVYLNKSINQYKVIDSVVNVIKFDTNYNSNHIKIQQIKPKSNRRFINWFIYFLTFPLQGILYFSVFSFFLLSVSDIGNWEDNIFGYLIESEFDVNDPSTDFVEIKIIGSYYNKLTQTFELPKIVFKENYNITNLKNKIVTDITDIKNNFIGYIRSIIAICLTGFMFGISFSMLFVSNTVILTVSVLFALLCAVVGIVVFIREFKKYRSICNNR